MLAVVAGLYTVLGRLGAVAVTATVQAILPIIGGTMIFWLGLQIPGSWSGDRST